jgi:hypothetical protein
MSNSTEFIAKCLANDIQPTICVIGGGNMAFALISGFIKAGNFIHLFIF